MGRFSTVVLDNRAIESLAKLEAPLEEAATAIQRHVPPGREREYALAALEEAHTWAYKAISHAQRAREERVSVEKIQAETKAAPEDT